jgi:hypothetical protein
MSSVAMAMAMAGKATCFVAQGGRAARTREASAASFAVRVMVASAGARRSVATCAHKERGHRRDGSAQMHLTCWSCWVSQADPE